MKLTLNLRARRYGFDSRNYQIWKEDTFTQTVEASHTALLICDVWDRHWSRGARERLDAMVPRMASVIDAARSGGGNIIHSPSDTMDFYVDYAARKRLKEIPRTVVPDELVRDDPMLPIDDSDGGSDTSYSTQQRVWTCQHPGIFVDESRDVISDNGNEIYSYLCDKKIFPKQLLIEFDELNRPSRTAAKRIKNAHRNLTTNGYSLIWTDNAADFLYVHESFQ